MLPGAHRVRATLAGGGLAEYWYAWRGGPRILAARAATPAALAREVARLTPAVALAFDAITKPQPSRAVLSGLISDYLRPAPGGGKIPHLSHLGDRTLKDRRARLDFVRETLGEMELEALGAAGARAELLAWRDEQGDTPMTADARLAALGMVLAWAKALDRIRVNPLADPWPKLYAVNRAEIIWTKPDLVRLLKGAPRPFRQAVLLSIYTGLRGSDVVRVTWAHVGKKAITLPTGKSRGRTHVIVPITAPLRALLAQMGRKDGVKQVGAVLNSSTGKPWTFWGLQTAMQRRKTELAQTVDLAAGTADLKGLRWHDLRGTAATRLIRAGLPPADVALVLGWERQRIEAIASYVTAEAIAAGMLARLNGTRGKGSL